MLSNTSLNSITIRNIDTDEHFTLSDVMLLRGNTFNSSKNMTIFPLVQGAYFYNDSVFKPTSIDFEIKYYESIEDLKSFLRVQDTALRLELNFTHKTIYCDVTYNSDSIETFTTVTSWRLSLLRLSMYYTIRELYYGYDEESSSTYPYTYPFTYATGSNASGYISFTNYGDIEAGITLKIYGESEYPYVGVNAAPESTLNSYRADLIIEEFNYIIYKNYLGNFSIVKGVEDVTEQRLFDSKGFITIPKGNITLYMDRIPKMDIELREYYYNV